MLSYGKKPKAGKKRIYKPSVETSSETLNFPKEYISVICHSLLEQGADSLNVLPGFEEVSEQQPDSSKGSHCEKD